jgi:hypothetical protein
VTRSAYQWTLVALFANDVPEDIFPDPWSSRLFEDATIHHPILGKMVIERIEGPPGTPSPKK